MALEIKKQKIVGKIDNLQEKLNGDLPINKLELIHLVNSWGKNENFELDEDIEEGYISIEYEAKECYDLSKLDTSEITDMGYLFYFSKFNGDISNWDVSNVTDMSGMFSGATNFNQDINNWDVSNVTDMSYMFQGAKVFNQALNSWDVSSVIDMDGMFQDASNFNQALNDWNVSKVTDMSYMFSGAKNFNQAILWDLSNVQHAFDVFYDAIAFETKFNNGNSLPEYTNQLDQWLKENSDKMLAIETLNKESTPEQKIAIIENKISNNKTTLDELFKEKNIDPNSKIGLETLKVYNDTHDKLKLELEELKTQVVDIATNDFNSI